MESRLLEPSARWTLTISALRSLDFWPRRFCWLPGPGGCSERAFRNTNPQPMCGS